MTTKSNGSSDMAQSGRLTARPASTATHDLLTPGLHSLGTDGGRDALFYVPPGITSGQVVPLIVMLHGAGGQAQHGIDPLRQLADETGFLLLAPPSRAQTWDVISRRRYGPDIAFIDAALETVFRRFAVDPTRIAVAGFSDGASYALSLGLMNGDLFTHVLAFAPGFMAPLETVGSPAVYIAHGTQDQVLNIDRCSRRIVPQLKDAGYGVRYHEFVGPHTLPPDIAREAIELFMRA